MAPSNRRLRAALLCPPSFVGLLGGVLFWWRSLYPSMMPRGPGWQGAVSAISFGFGYLLGALAGYVASIVLRRLGHEPDERVRRWAWIGLGVVGAAVVGVGLATWLRWQNDQRDLLGMEHMSAVALVPMVGVTLVVLAALALIGRLVGHGVRWVDRMLARRVPAAAAHAITAVAVLVIALVVTRGLVFDGSVSWMNERWARFDTTTAAGVEQPPSPARSGSPASLVPWDTLGEYGRTFVAQATTEAQLRAFHGPDAEVAEPVRAYAGLRSADSPDERAALAVRDLERAGGFDREVVCVVTATGSGWVDPDGVLALELLHAGDTAIISQQYSYLPSWLAFIVHRDRAAEAGAVLYEHVYRRWSELPEASRPRLVIFGESLGSYGAEAPFVGSGPAESLANMADGASAMLFTGPTAANTIWKQLTEARQPGTPVWRPVYDGGTTVQFANRPSNLEPPPTIWREPRILYVHHPSDPVGNWSWSSLWRRPAWMDDPLGYDITPNVSWFPFVSGLQEVSDLIAGFGAPSGYGHNYDVDFASAWAAVVPPEGWTTADTERLQAHIPSESI